MAEEDKGNKRVFDGSNEGGGNFVRGGGKRQRGQEGKVLPPTVILRREVDRASGKGDWRAGFATFDKAVNEDIPLQPHTCNVLLHLCTVAAAADDAGMSKEELMAQAQKMFDYMKEKKISLTEASYTALVRVMAANAQPEKAFAVAKQIASDGLVPKVRSFAPVMTSFCNQGKMEEANQVVAHMQEAGLHLTETEYMSLLSANMRAGRWEEGLQLLKNMAETVDSVSQEMCKVLRGWFASDVHARTGRQWEVGSCTVSDEGVCSATGSQLMSIDLTPEEREGLAAGIRKLAMERERKDDFDEFAKWLEDNGPVGVFVDGANVGMFNQNFADARFNFRQVDRMMTYLDEQPRAEGHCAPLLVLHKFRTTKGVAKEEASQKLIAKFNEKKWLWATPPGSNDDWYWLYGAVKSGEKSFLVTNDEMRDHIFQMLPDPKLFRKWKDRHQVHFSLGKNQVTCMFPRPYSHCIQELSDGSWYFPVETDEDMEQEGWLYARPIAANE